MNKKISNKVIFIYTLAVIIVATIFYPILPSILNYPPDSINNDFQRHVESTLLYKEQYIIIIFLSFIVGLLAIKLRSRKIDSFINNDFTNYNPNNLKLINNLFNFPYTIYLLHLIIPSLSIFILYTITEGQINIGTIKITLVIITMQTLIALICIVYCKKIVSNILKKLCINKKYISKTSSLKNNIFIIILPMILVALIFTSLIGYSITVQEKSEYMFIANEMLLNENIIDTSYSYNEIYNILNNLELLQNEDTIFIIFSENNYTTLNNTNLTDFFIKYTIEQSSIHKNRTYDTYGTDKQGAVMQLKIDGKNAYVGIQFSITSNTIFNKIVSSIVLLFLLNCIVLYYIASSLADNTTKITVSLKEILKLSSNYKQIILPITSNDELAELTIAFNEIQELTNQHLKEIQNNQEMLIEQERLASLGQMIGGIAHNLKTPIFSIAGGLEGLSDLVNEYDASIDNNTVTSQDMHDIASDMREWLDKLKEHISYMSDVITAVKGQTVTLADNASVDFPISELFKRVDILMKHELKNALATLDIQNNVEDSILLKGNLNSLVQIINNIISNSIEAYGNNYTDKKIELIANITNQNIVIAIRDYGPGISEIAQRKLFKEMITTKGKNGTGLGMFMSYSNIKAHFNGDLTYETELGKGTTFYITLPIK